MRDSVGAEGKTGNKALGVHQKDKGVREFKAEERRMGQRSRRRIKALGEVRVGQSS